MRLSKTLPKEITPEKVVDFTPKLIERDLTQAAQNFIESRQKNITAFRLSDLVASQAGIAEREKSALDQKAESLALEKVKEIQEPAYQQAYELGLEEGRKKAFEAAESDIGVRLQKLDELLISFTKIKEDMLHQSEGQIVKAVYELAIRIAKFEISQHDDRILGVIRQAVEHAQSQESVAVKLSKEDFDFLQTIKDYSKREMEFMKKIKLTPTNDIKSGGCIVETNYGVIDATVEERINNLWAAIESKIAKPKEKLEG